MRFLMGWASVCLEMLLCLDRLAPLALAVVRGSLAVRRQCSPVLVIVLRASDRRAELMNRRGRQHVACQLQFHGSRVSHARR